MKKETWVSIGVTLLICLAMALLVMIAGCTEIFGIMADPNSGLNKAVDLVGSMSPAAGATAAATGTPWGACVFFATTVISAVLGVYKNYRKNIVIGDKEAELSNFTVTTKAIVDMVEALPDEAKERAKVIVEKNLKDKDFYQIGKAIISGLKSS